MKIQTQKVQQGFTLIELMIVVAIIGILASIAIPAYSEYVAKSQFAAGLAEISPGKVQMETKLNENSAWTPVDATSIGLQTSTKNCSQIDVAAGDPSTIKCTLIGNAAVNTKIITLSRDQTTGVWTCGSDLGADKEKYAGKCDGDF